MVSERCTYTTVDGLDATGKSTLIKRLSDEANVVCVKSPPQWMNGLRKVFDSLNANIRFHFYALGNLWIDRYLIKPLINDTNFSGFIVQDRSWLSTFSAHELRKTDPDLLQKGLQYARKSTEPNLSLIIHVDREERLRRLYGRNFITNIDKENIKFEEKMEEGYFNWGRKLGWNTIVFNNTEKDINQAYLRLKEIIFSSYQQN
jgi:thymidylate kinase